MVHGHALLWQVVLVYGGHITEKDGSPNSVVRHRIGTVCHAFAEDDHIAGSGKNRYGHFIFLFCLAEGIGEICLVTARYGRKGAVFYLCHIRKNNNAFCARAL